MRVTATVLRRALGVVLVFPGALSAAQTLGIFNAARDRLWFHKLDLLQLGGFGSLSAFRHAAIDPHGDRVYVRSFYQVEAYDFDPFSGEFGVEPLFVTPLQRFTTACAGTPNIAVHPDGTKLYVTEEDNSTLLPANVRILDAVNGKMLGGFTLETTVPWAIRVEALAEGDRRLRR